MVMSKLLLQVDRVARLRNPDLACARQTGENPLQTVDVAQHPLSDWLSLVEQDRVAKGWPSPV